MRVFVLEVLAELFYGSSAVLEGAKVIFSCVLELLKTPTREKYNPSFQ